MTDHFTTNDESTTGAMSYPAGLAVRSSAHLADHLSWIADSWSAAAPLGIPVFEAGQDACIIPSHHGLTEPSTHRSTSCRRLRPDPAIPLRPDQ